MYDELEKYFDNEDILDALLQDYKIKFKQVEDYWDSLQKGEIVGYDAIDETLTKLTGLYMELNVIAIIADTEVQKKKGFFNLQFTREAENEGKKVVQSSIDRQVDKAVQPWRRVRNILQAYCDSCKSGKETAQSRLKVFSETRGKEN